MKKTILLVTVVLVISLAACGAPNDPQDKAKVSTPTVIQQGSNTTTSTNSPGNATSNPTPTNASASAVNYYLLGGYYMWETGCEDSSGTIDAQMSFSDTRGDVVIIRDKELISDILDADSNCEIIYTYPITGIDTTKIVLGNPKVEVLKDGVTDTAGACSQFTVPYSNATSSFSFEYRFSFSELRLYWPKNIFNCDSGQKSVSAYLRGY